MKFDELLNKDYKELKDMENALRKEYFNLRLLSKTTQEVKTHGFRRCRRDIARVLTRMRQISGGVKNA